MLESKINKFILLLCFVYMVIIKLKTESQTINRNRGTFDTGFAPRQENILKTIVRETKFSVFG